MMFWSDIVLKELQFETPVQAADCLIGAMRATIHSNEKLNWWPHSAFLYVCPVSSWNSLIGRTENMRRNIQNAAKHGRK